MVCGGGAQVRKRIELMDTSCVMQEVLRGGYQSQGSKTLQKASSLPDPTREPQQKRPEELGTLEPAVTRDLLHLIAMKASKWTYTVEQGAEVAPPEPSAFVVRTGQILRLSWAPLQVTLSDNWVQEQFGLFLVTVEGKGLLPPLRVLVLAFRGTARAQDILGNISPLLNENAFAKYGMNVHSAWHGLVASQRHLDLLWAVLNDAAKHGAAELLITGHSMGGALGQITALQILQKLDEARDSLPATTKKLASSLSCVSFGAPMPFAPEAPERLSVATLHAQRRALDWLSARCLTYVNNNDVVPRLPGCIDFLREMLKTVRPANFVYKFGLSVLEGSPVIRRYRPVSCVSMLGHLEVRDGHARLDLSPADPDCARAMMTRYSSDTWHAECPFRGPLTWCKLSGWLTGGSVYSLKDHLMERYEGYLLMATNAKELSSPTLRRKLGFYNHEFRQLKDAPAIMAYPQRQGSKESNHLPDVQRKIKRANSL